MSNFFSFEDFYLNSNKNIQNIIFSIYGLWWRKRRFGGSFKEYYNDFRKRESFSETQWEEYQTKKLRKILLHAYNNVPFYKKKYSQYGFTSESFSKFSLSDLNKLPILEKDDLRLNCKKLLMSEKHDKNGGFFESSGSTGTPVSIYYSRDFHQKWSAAFESRIRNWAGVNRFVARGMIGGRLIMKKENNNPPFHRYNIFEKQTYFSAFHISEKNAKYYCQAMIDNKVEYMTGYAMSNYLLAKIFKMKNIIPPKMKCVITSSEKLTNSMRNLLAEVYRCNVYDSYSGVEACNLFSQHKNGKVLNSPDVGILELINDNGSYVKEGEPGQIISTGLLNFDQPLIRYRIGDIATISKNQKNDNTLFMQEIKSIDGRIEDVIISEDGSQLVRFHSIFLNINGLIKSQIIQFTINEFQINLHVDKFYIKHVSENVMIKRFKERIGQKIKIKFKYNSKFFVEETGKYKSVISKLKK